MKRININDIEIEYKIYNPGGNITALVKGCEYNKEEKKIINDLIMKENSLVEQVGFLSDKEYRLEMAGGEFCLNATRCAVYDYLNGKEGNIKISVSGVKDIIKGFILSNGKVEVIMNINKSISDLISIKDNLYLINLDGILIVIMNYSDSKEYINRLKINKNKEMNNIKENILNKIDSDASAIGLMLLEDNKINPIVWVKDIDTLFYETACGSGSLGTAIYNYYINKDTNMNIIQPSGYSIDIELDIKDELVQYAKIKGIVKNI